MKQPQRWYTPLATPFAFTPLPAVYLTYVAVVVVVVYLTIVAEHHH